MCKVQVVFGEFLIQENIFKNGESIYGLSLKVKLKNEAPVEGLRAVPLLHGFLVA